METALERAAMLYSDAARSVTWSAVLTYGGIALASYAFYRLIMEPFLSPLRKVPGLHFIPFIGNLRYITRGQAMESSINMMREFGGVMRYYFFMGQERLLITDPDVMKQVFVTNSKNYVKPPARFKLLKMVLGEGLVTSEGAVHAAHKRLMSPSFNQTSIKKMLPVFQEMATRLADQWLEALGNSDNAIVTVHQDLTRTTLDIIGKTAFGYEFNALKDPDNVVNQRVQKILSGSGLNWRFLVPKYFTLPFPDVLEFRESMQVITKTVENIIGQKRQQIKKGEDLESVGRDCLGMMMQAKDDSTGTGMSDAELRDQVITLMLAGHETTAVAMAWLLLVLSQHPDIQSKARDEILTVFPTRDTEITWERLEQLEFCNCIVKETLRMYPPVPLTLRQCLKPDIFKNEYYIPAGTIMLMSIGPMMRSEKLFEDPDTFRPERFYDQQVNQTMYHFLPFIVGTRMCLGHKFAQLEMKSLMVVLLQQLHYQPIKDQQYKRLLRTTMRPDPLLELHVSRVKDT